MAVIIEEGKVNNGYIVPSKPLPLPEGTKVCIQTFFRMWADREDMRDSVAWVRKQREKWKERLTDSR